MWFVLTAKYQKKQSTRDKHRNLFKKKKKDTLMYSGALHFIQNSLEQR